MPLRGCNFYCFVLLLPAMFKALIIDDEAEARKAVNNILTTFCHNVEVLGEADGVASGIELITKKEPDVVFLDVEMADGTAFDLLQNINPIHFHVVFITAYEKYAIRAIKFSALDYLLKPIDPQQLIDAVNKLSKVSPRENQSDERIELLMDNKKSLSKLALPTLNGYRFIRVKDIIRCEANNNYTSFYLQTTERILVTKTLKDFESLLKDDSFIRVHQSHLINVDYVEQYIKGEGGVAIMSDGSQVEISRRRKDKFLRGMLR
jgi:two-component system LytT family response regulator